MGVSCPLGLLAVPQDLLRVVQGPRRQVWGRQLEQQMGCRAGLQAPGQQVWCRVGMLALLHALLWAEQEPS